MPAIGREKHEHKPTPLFDPNQIQIPYFLPSMNRHLSYKNHGLQNAVHANSILDKMFLYSDLHLSVESSLCYIQFCFTRQLSDWFNKTRVIFLTNQK